MRGGGLVRDGYGVFLGLDVGKGDHHTVGLAPDGKRLHDAPLPNTEVRLRQLFDKLARHGRVVVVVVVDQPASIGALPVAVARACGHQVAYLPGLAMRRIADLHPGSAKTAPVTPTLSRTRPTLCRIRYGGSTPATRPWLSWKSSSALTTTSPARPLGCRIGSGAC